MSRYLLDTHVLIWSVLDLPRLTATHAAILSSAAPQFVSVVSIWEIGIKQNLGKLHLERDVIEALPALGYRVLDITQTHAVAAGRLPLLHRDPFDRMLVAQALAEGLTLLSGDPRLAAYGVRVV